MSEYVFKLPDLGEGTVEAEIVAWHVRLGDAVAEDDALVDIMTDKANVEIPSPVAGTVLRIGGEPGDIVAVGAELIAFATAAPASAAAAKQERRAVPDAGGRSAPPAPASERAHARADAEPASAEPAAPLASAPNPRSRKVAAAPAVRRRALEAGVDLAQVSGSGPRGRVLQQDLSAWLAKAAPAGGSASAAKPLADGDEDGIETIAVTGVRRVTAERMAASKREIPHFSYIEEVDVTEVEALRQRLNDERAPNPRLTLLPFVALALIDALRAFPQCNAHFDAGAGAIRRFRAVHLGIATHTAQGLMAPVVRHAQRLSLWQLAAAMAALAAAARRGVAKREHVGGSTVTLTSLGALGGIASTPVINPPEVTIVGVNRAAPRPVALHGAVTVRTMMNLSASFDHRAIDGMDAASMIGHAKRRLEHPAMLFV